MSERTAFRRPFVLAAAVGFALTAGASVARAGAADGKTLYDKQCQACHSVKGEGGKMKDKGGPLDGVGAKRDAGWLKAYLKDPKSKTPDAKMPKLPIADASLEDLVAYLLTLK